MRLVPSPEQQQFAASLHALMTAADTPGLARRWAGGEHEPGLELWHRLAGLGVTALAVSQRWGGLDAHPADIVVACEELGHHALPGPVAESVAAVPALIEALGDESLCETWLPKLSAGEVLATLCAPPWLPYATDADIAGLVVLAGTDTVQRGAPGSSRRSVDPTRRLFAVAGEGVPVHGPVAARAVARALDVGALANAAQLLGAGRALLERTAEHARQRVQFGRPIGQFQAVKHRLADVAIGLEFARPLLHAAAVTFAADAPTATRDVSAAKVACADAAHRAARAALQIHGAVGYTTEHPISLWIAKVQALVPSWGTQAEHRARVMAALTMDTA